MPLCQQKEGSGTKSLFTWLPFCDCTPTVGVAEILLTVIHQMTFTNENLALDISLATAGCRNVALVLHEGSPMLSTLYSNIQQPCAATCDEVYSLIVM